MTTENMTTTDESQPIYKVFLSWLFLALALITLGYFGFEIKEMYRLKNLTEAEKLALIWERDLKVLAEQKKLPKGWSDIREVALMAPTPKSKDWIRKITSPIPVKIKGNHRLEVMVLNWEDEGAEGAVIQYNLIDLKSGNMIWELGRTYTLKEAPAKPAPVAAPKGTAPIAAPKGRLPQEKVPTSGSNKQTPKPSASPAGANSH